MPDDLTTAEAAAYLAERGYKVGRRRVGGTGSPTPSTIKRWCALGKLPGAEKYGGQYGTWLIPKSALDALLEKVTDQDTNARNDT